MLNKLISNNLELAAKYLPNDDEESIRYKYISEIDDNTIFAFDTSQKDSFLIADNDEESNEKNVLIAEIIIKGWEKHPEGRKLELAAYDSMSIKPGSIVNNQILKKDLNSIYASGWFSEVKIKSNDGPLGVRLIVNVVPNPILKKVILSQSETVISTDFIDDIFKNNYGTTINLNELQSKLDKIKEWYEDRVTLWLELMPRKEFQMRGLFI